jgi:hypothetical protein
VGAETGIRAGDDHRRRAVLTRLALDAAAVEAIAALQEVGISVILLKGPVIALWLYDQPWERTYGDIDLLVAPADHQRASTVLARLGYHDHSLADIPAHASQWRRETATRAEIDLHWRLPLAGRDVDPWPVLSAETEAMAIGSTTVRVLSPAARAMLVAVHAAQHGARAPKPMRDLERALARVDRQTWARAAALAQQLNAEGAFTVGLRLVPAGAEMATALALAPSSSIEAHLRSVTPTATSVGWMHLLEQPSPRAGLELLRGELVPNPGFMRVWSPLARRGRLGLACAYLLRPLWLVWQLPAALRDLGRARRQARR